MTPQVTTATLDESALRRVLLDLPNKPLTAIYLESPTRTVLTRIEDYLGPRITLPPVRWLVGRAFGPDLEIRWTLDGTETEATALTEDPALGPTGWQKSAWQSLLDPVPRPRDMLLMGINSASLPTDHAGYNLRPGGGLWIDNRSPNALPYPTADPKARRVVVRCLDYLYRGMPVLTRLCSIEPYRDPMP